LRGEGRSERTSPSSIWGKRGKGKGSSASYPAFWGRGREKEEAAERAKSRV